MVPFSLDELQSAPEIELPAMEKIKAGDGVKLAFRAYIPEAPQAVLIFYHGGGAHGGAGYQYIGDRISRDYGVAAVIPDIRGHGASGGARGDAPGSKQVMDDVDKLIEEVGRRFTGIPLFLGGHSSGAGLLLNHLSAGKMKAVAGYVFVSPNLGPLSGIARKGGSFAKFSVIAFIAHCLTGGRLFGHSRAVRLNYPEEVLDSDAGLLPYYTINMSNAVTPYSPGRRLRQLRKPLGVWIGELDELFDPGKVEAFVKRSCPDAYVARIPGEKHLSIFLKAAGYIGPWILRLF